MRYQNENADVKFPPAYCGSGLILCVVSLRMTILCDVLEVYMNTTQPKIHVNYRERDKVLLLLLLLLFLSTCCLFIYFGCYFFLIGQAISGRVAPSSRPVWRCDSHQSHFK